MTFAVAVLLALVKLGGFSGAKPFFLKVVPATPIDKAAQVAVGSRETHGGGALDLPTRILAASPTTYST